MPRLHVARPAHGIALVMLLMLPRFAGAANRVTGVVRDAETGMPVPSVIMWAQGTAGPEVYWSSTDAQGVYDFPHLPPDNYFIQLSAMYYADFFVDDIKPREGGTLQVDVTLPRWEPRERREDSAAAFNSPAAPTPYSFTNSLASWFPLGRPHPGASATRSIERTFEQSPFIVDTSAGLAALGASTLDNDFVLNGLSTTDGLFGFNALPLSTSLLSDGMELRAQAESSTTGHFTGAVFAANTPGPSRELQGTLFAHWAPGVLQGSRCGVRRADPLRGTPWHQGDFGATLRIPIIENRLHGFFGVAPALGRVRPSSSRGNFVDQRDLQGLARLTYQPDDQSSLSLMYARTSSALKWADAVEDRAVTLGSQMVDLTYRSVLLYEAASVLLQARWMGQSLSHDTPQAPPTGETCGDTLLDALAGCGIQDRATRRLQARARATFTLSDMHAFELRLGVDDLEHEATRSLEAPSETKLGRTAINGLFLYTFEFARGFEVLAGVQFDRQQLDVPDAASPHGSSQWSPHLAFTLSPFHRNKSKFYVSLTRRHGWLPLGLVEPEVVEGRAQPVAVDPSLNPTTQPELAVGFQLQLPVETSLRGDFVRRWLDDGVSFMRDTELGQLRLVNPGRGSASELPRAKRDHHSVTVQVAREAQQGLQARMAYTWSHLQGDLLQPLSSRSPLSLPLVDRRHVIKLLAA
ncbi:carboxypeptidase-like regulatory domain-containing protein [Myxococcus landrumensis]|uniref:Carboxypeptidase regulatory-like domain-containing protein n=1 Tax=Myxococcus landrumensis TaxID=2813577 RepID=A0ABX7MXM6_9BACT|nr:carboxypeptidase-like regulatory domain-containing protein [Myxococcus landrumus]QSQ11207.1 carboxypeptidase regulatory-like domain-containing protein [Myxococcus landrumus]